MKVDKIVLTGASLITSICVSSVVGQTIKSLSPKSTKLISKAIMGLGGMAISAVLSEKVAEGIKEQVSAFVPAEAAITEEDATIQEVVEVVKEEMKDLEQEEAPKETKKPSRNTRSKKTTPTVKEVSDET